MKTRVRKIFDYWVVEFAFGCVVYCEDFESAIETATAQWDYYLQQGVALAKD